MFRVKICGVRLESDVRAVDHSGGDAVGFNFFPPSVRFVDPAAAATKRLADVAAELGLRRIGVFVNESAQTIASVATCLGLDAVQLHGDETPEVASQLNAAGRRVIRAIKLPKSAFDVNTISAIVEPWIALGCQLLLDVDAGSNHGGSGKTLDWPSVAAWAEANPAVRWTLAGGLKPENVGQAIQITGAISVDTASGVECPRGVKDSSRIEAFIRASRIGPK